jgi:Winged helix DNA-binding domain
MIVLGDRALNRATLARQLLLERVERPARDVVHHLVGMQAQVPRNPYVALWARLEGFRPEELERLIVDREVVRIGVMRGTIHLLTADDSLLLRPLTQPVLDAVVRNHPEVRSALDGVDLEPVLAYARSLLAERPSTASELRVALGERFPDQPAAALSIACVATLPLVQVPPRGLWSLSSRPTLAPLDTWLGRPFATRTSLDAVILRYLGAFGPATVADASTWSRLTGMRAVFERLRHRLVTFRDERGRELFDLPDAPRPDPGTPAPVRFLPEYDNVLLSHDDRARLISPATRGRLSAAGGVGWGAILVDGTGWGMWRLLGDELVIRHADRPGRSSVTAEAMELLRFLDADAKVRFEQA